MEVALTEAADMSHTSEQSGTDGHAMRVYIPNSNWIRVHSMRMVRVQVCFWHVRDGFLALLNKKLFFWVLI